MNITAFYTDTGMFTDIGFVLQLNKKTKLLYN